MKVNYIPKHKDGFAIKNLIYWQTIHLHLLFEKLGFNMYYNTKSRRHQLSQLNKKNELHDKIFSFDYLSLEKDSKLCLLFGSNSGYSVFKYNFKSYEEWMEILKEDYDNLKKHKYRNIKNSWLDNQIKILKNEKE